jgi:hypothetical protein
MWLKVSSDGPTGLLHHFIPILQRCLSAFIKSERTLDFKVLRTLNLLVDAFIHTLEHAFSQGKLGLNALPLSSVGNRSWHDTTLGSHASAVNNPEKSSEISIPHNAK